MVKKWSNFSYYNASGKFAREKFLKQYRKINGVLIFKKSDFNRNLIFCTSFYESFYWRVCVCSITIPIAFLTTSNSFFTVCPESSLEGKINLWG
ncbi:MAG: hypothetical protein ACD_78C00349G0001, partial [uncultured bacterium (gcode 4)]